MEELKEIRMAALKHVDEIVMQNKEDVIRSYRLAVGLAHICRKEGILALEYAAGFIPENMILGREIMEMVRLTTDGENVKFISEMLTIRFVSNQYCGLEALLYYLYARSFLFILTGASPCQIESFFHSAMPGEVLSFGEQHNILKENNMEKLRELKAALSDMEKKRLSEVSERLHDLTEQEWGEMVGSSGFHGFEIILPFLNRETQALTAVYMNPYRYQTIIHSPKAVREQEMLQALEELEEKIAALRERDSHPCLLEELLKYTDEEIRNLIEDTGRDTLTVALKGVNREIRECFYRNMTSREKYCLQEDMEYMGPVQVCDVEAAQRRIMQVAKGKGSITDGGV